MDYVYKIADKSDIEALVLLRQEVLTSANCLDANTEMPEVKLNTNIYYLKAFEEDSHYAIIVYDGDIIIATGAICFYQVMHTYNNPKGTKAYVMNMYTKEAYRRKGVAQRILKELVHEAKRRNVSEITLEATEMGKPLYLKNGFELMKSEMEYI